MELENILTLVMLIFLQAVLGFDNLLYISIESKRVTPEKQQLSAKRPRPDGGAGGGPPETPPDSAGRPAHEVLTPELEFLSQIAGRNFLAELRAPPLSP